MKVFSTIMISIFAFLFILLITLSKNRLEHIGKIFMGVIIFSIIFALLSFWDSIEEASIKDLFTLRKQKELARIELEELRRVSEEVGKIAERTENLRERMENNSATIDIIAKKAMEMENLYNDVSSKNDVINKRIEEFYSFLQESQQQIDSIVEAINPYTKRITTANCYVGVAVSVKTSSPLNRPSNSLNPDGLLLFSNEDGVLLSLTAPKVIQRPSKIEPKKVEVSGSSPYYIEIRIFQVNFSLSTPSTFTKMVVKDLKETSMIFMSVGGIQREGNIHEGKGRCSINSVLDFEFTIQPQIVRPDRYFISTGVSQLKQSLE